MEVVRQLFPTHALFTSFLPYLALVYNSLFYHRLCPSYESCAPFVHSNKAKRVVCKCGAFGLVSKKDRIPASIPGNLLTNHDWPLSLCLCHLGKSALIRAMPMHNLLGRRLVAPVLGLLLWDVQRFPGVVKQPILSNIGVMLRHHKVGYLWLISQPLQLKELSKTWVVILLFLYTMSVVCSLIGPVQNSAGSRRGPHF